MVTTLSVSSKSIDKLMKRVCKVFSWERGKQSTDWHVMKLCEDITLGYGVSRGLVHFNLDI
jgi:hypothetical protein